MPILPNIEDKQTYVARPEIPSNQKLIDTEFNLLKNSVYENALRIVWKFETDVGNNQILYAGQYVDYSNNIYEVVSTHNVGTPKAFTLANYQIKGASVAHSTQRTAATTLTLNVPERTYIFDGSSDAVWTCAALAGNTNLRLWIKHCGTAKLTVQKSGSDRLFDFEPVEFIELFQGDKKCLVWDGEHIQVL